MKLRWISSSKSIKVCPRCGSPKIRLSSELDFWLTPKRYLCNECGYLGPVVLELEVKEFEKV